MFVMEDYWPGLCGGYTGEKLSRFEDVFMFHSQHMPELLRYTRAMAYHTQTHALITKPSL